MQFSLDGFESGPPVVKTHARIGTPAYRRAAEGPVLLPSSLEDEIPSNHLVRKIWEAVQALDLSPVQSLYSHKGGAPYPPERLLAVILFGMTEGVRSSRDLEERCRYDLRYRYLMGDLKPDDRTFGRFLERIDPVCEQIFRSMSLLLESRGLCKVREVGVDGVKTSCSASWWKYSASSQEPPTDPEARILQSHGRYLVGYNAQFAVDLSEGSIVGVGVLSEQNDFHAVALMLDTIERQSGSCPSAVFADAGYDSCGNIQTLENRGIDSVINAAKPLPAEVFEDGEGVLRCMAGREMVLNGHKTFKSGVMDTYRPEGGCVGCCLKSECGFFRKCITVPKGCDPGARFRNKTRLESATYHRAMVRRMRMEKVFAIRNRCDKFDRILRKGKAKALTELLLWSISYNIRLWARALQDLLSLISSYLGRSRRTWKSHNLHKMAVLSIRLENCYQTAF
jgi:transposase